MTTADAQQVADQANALVARTVTVSDGEDKHSASAKTKASWVTIPTTDGAPGTPTIDAGEAAGLGRRAGQGRQVEPPTACATSTPRAPCRRS